MNHKNLTGMLPGCFALGLFGLTCVSAQAQGSWVISPVSYGTNETIISPTDADLGAGGFCYNTSNSSSPYYILSASLINNLSVSGLADYFASQEINWSGSGTSTPVDINLAANASGVI